MNFASFWFCRNTSQRPPWAASQRDSQSAQSFWERLLLNWIFLPLGTIRARSMNALRSQG